MSNLETSFISKFQNHYSARGYPKSLTAAKYAIVSYSQFAEDLLLQNFFGFFESELRYLDIGAFHPINHSNSYLSYLKGCIGMAVEPNPQMSGLWAKYRPKDKFMNLAISPNSSGQLQYYMNSDSPGLNYVSPDLEMKEHFTRCTLDCIAIKELLVQYLDLYSRLDFLTIDVEGLDFELLKAFPFDRVRPRAIVIEDFHPGEDSLIEQLMRQNRFKRFAHLRISKIFIDCDNS